MTQFSHINRIARQMARSDFAIHMIVIACLTGGTILAPASAAELVRVNGVMAEGGIVCPLFRSDDGTIFPLMGLNQNEHAIGTRLELEGTFVKRSTCQQGEKTFNVESVIGVGGSENR
jgi:hypothetical protein